MVKRDGLGLGRGGKMEKLAQQIPNPSVGAVLGLLDAV
jgi:hypothetical protein